MAARQWWHQEQWKRWQRAGAVSLAAVGATGLAVTSGIALLARRFVDELAHPGVAPDILSGWLLPQVTMEPDASLRRPLAFHASDGTLLRGEFWAQPQPAPTIVICHGYRVNSTQLRPVAALEYAYGSNVLLFDFRGHGESARIPTSGGNAEVGDLTAALDLATAQPETLPGRIFIHGFSMGAAVALLLPPRPDVAGIIADSPYARLDEILRELVSWQLKTESDTWPRPLRWLRAAFPAVSQAIFFASDLLFRVRYRYALRARPEQHVRRLPKLRTPRRITFPWQARTPRREVQIVALPHRPPLLLIHALRDPFVRVDHALRIARAALAGNVPLELHFADSDVHCGAYGCNPDEYVSWVRGFIARA